MTGPADGADVRHIAIEAILPNDPETVWKALTAPEPVARRLMPNDFEATLGNCFKSQAKPMGGWDGVVECEVLEILPSASSRTAEKAAPMLTRNTGRAWTQS
ncbi:MAG: hypothetical protein ACLPIX_06430 [Rhodomicrobium sp.]